MHMFAPDELAGDSAVAKELEADVLEECTRIGPVMKVRRTSNSHDSC